MGCVLTWAARSRGRSLRCLTSTALEPLDQVGDLWCTAGIVCASAQACCYLISMPRTVSQVGLRQMRLNSWSRRLLPAAMRYTNCAIPKRYIHYSITGLSLLISISYLVHSTNLPTQYHTRCLPGFALRVLTCSYFNVLAQVEALGAQEKLTGT